MVDIEQQDFSKKETEKRKKIFWKLYEIETESSILVDNIRPIDPLVVEDLANSISEIGQLSPCIGDTIVTENGEFVRIIAGQHRFHAINLLHQKGEDIPLLARIANRTLNDEEILSIQMSENLQNKMTAEQDAKIIHSFWQKCCQLYGEEVVTLKYLSRKLGRSTQKISEAIKFVEDLSPKVQEMVQKGVLHYSTALLLTRLDWKSENGNDFYSEQVRTAVFLISQGYNKDEARRYLDKRIKEKSYTEPLFSNEVWKELKKNGYRIAIRDKSSKEGRNASGWFVRMIRTVSLLDEPSRVEFSEAIERSVEELGLSMEDFKNNLKSLGVTL